MKKGCGQVRQAWASSGFHLGGLVSVHRVAQLCIMYMQTFLSSLICAHCLISESQSLRDVKEHLDFPGGSDGKASVYNVGDPGWIPGLGRCPGEGNGNPLQHSCLENPMDGGALRATVHGVAKSQTRLSDFTYLLT